MTSIGYFVFDFLAKIDYICTCKTTIRIMKILLSIIILLVFCLAPALVLWLCRRYAFLDKIGPIIILYGVGILVGNLPVDIEGITWNGEGGALYRMADLTTQVTIPLAIPMMLFASCFKLGELRQHAKVIISGFVALFIAVTIGYLLVGYRLDKGAEIGGIMSGMYSGGMVNAAALKNIFHDVDETSYNLMCLYDVILSFLYLLFLVSVGFKLFRRLYGERSKDNLTSAEREELERQMAESKRNPYEGLWSRDGVKELGKIVGVTIIIIGISALATIPFSADSFMMIFILVLSTLGVACSFYKPIRELKRSFDIGMYLIYIFSVAMASMADFSKFDIADGLNQIYFLTISIFGSLTLHALFCRLMRVDADSMVVSSVAFVNSPPFVPMMVIAMKNRGVLITGLVAGIVGYAAGNYFGVLMANFLELL